VTTIPDLLDPRRVAFFECAEIDPIHELCRLATRSGRVREALERAVRAREEMGCTALDCGVAVPHGHIPELREFVMAVGICPDGLEWLGHPQDRPVRIVILIGAPEDRQSGYLRLLSKIVKLFDQPEICEQIVKCCEPEAVVEQIRRRVAELG